jgi:hypothetical protein
VLDRDALHAQVVVEAVEVDAREGSLDVHAQHGGDLVIPPCVLDHLYHFVERVGGGPPRSGAKLIRWENTSELSFSDLLQILCTVQPPWEALRESNGSVCTRDVVVRLPWLAQYWDAELRPVVGEVAKFVERTEDGSYKWYKQVSALLNDTVGDGFREHCLVWLHFLGGAVQEVV